jgi:hypothetical protein
MADYGLSRYVALADQRCFILFVGGHHSITVGFGFSGGEGFRKRSLLDVEGLRILKDTSQVYDERDKDDRWKMMPWYLEWQRELGAIVQSHVIKLTQRRKVMELNLTTAELSPATICADDSMFDEETSSAELEALKHCGLLMM